MYTGEMMKGLEMRIKTLSVYHRKSGFYSNSYFMLAECSGRATFNVQVTGTTGAPAVLQPDCCTTRLLGWFQRCIMSMEGTLSR